MPDEEDYGGQSRLPTAGQNANNGNVRSQPDSPIFPPGPQGVFPPFYMASIDGSLVIVRSCHDDYTRAIDYSPFILSDFAHHAHHIPLSCSGNHPIIIIMACHPAHPCDTCHKTRLQSQKEYVPHKKSKTSRYRGMCVCLPLPPLPLSLIALAPRRLQTFPPL